MKINLETVLEVSDETQQLTGEEVWVVNKVAGNGPQLRLTTQQIDDEGRAYRTLEEAIEAARGRIESALEDDETHHDNQGAQMRAENDRRRAALSRRPDTPGGGGPP